MSMNYGRVRQTFPLYINIDLFKFGSPPFQLQYFKMDKIIGF